MFYKTQFQFLPNIKTLKTIKIMFKIKLWQIFDLQLWANKEPLRKYFMHVEKM